MKIKKAGEVIGPKWPDGSGKVTSAKVTDNRIGGGSSNEEGKGV